MSTIYWTRGGEGKLGKGMRKREFIRIMVEVDILQMARHVRQHGRAGLGSLESSNLGNILNYTIKRRDVEGGRKEGGERGTERGTKT